MLLGIYVKSNFPMRTISLIAALLLMCATETLEPMKRKRHSGGTTVMKWSMRGANIGFGRFSMRRATRDSLKGDFGGPEYSRDTEGRLEASGCHSSRAMMLYDC